VSDDAKTATTTTMTTQKKLSKRQQAALDRAQRLQGVGFANEGQFLLVSQASVGRIGELAGPSSNNNSSDGDNEDNLSADRCRPNLLVSGATAFSEDAWRSVCIIGVSESSGSRRHAFDIVGPCVRCTMVNVNQDTANRKSRLFAALAAHRRRNGKIVFGVLLGAPKLVRSVALAELPLLHVGDTVEPS
jgi:uncharacterized protein YcbX